MNIFVHRASECLTDYLPFGDGLIAYSLLAELAKRGHRIFAYTNRNGVEKCPEGLTIRARMHRVPANSLHPWEHSWRADRWLRELEREHTIDLVWRLQPYDIGCPTRPYTGGRPLVVGPLFYGWPCASMSPDDLAKPRFGVGIRPLTISLAKRGWARTLRDAALVICATEGLSRQTASRTRGRVMTLPVIVDPPAELVHDRPSPAPSAAPRLLFAANLHRNKHPLVFCQTILELRRLGLAATGTILGDGVMRGELETWCRENSLAEAIHFAGKVPNSEVYRRQTQADWLVSTSLGEPYGLSIIEAMSVGTVPICHRSGGPADFIDPEKTGLLVDALDGSVYAQAIAKIWTEPSAWKRLSDAAMDQARQWKPKVVVDQLVSAMEKLLPATQFTQRTPIAVAGGGR
jgi:glycosyltransferase involved in cell wall biosynthesis